MKFYLGTHQPHWLGQVDIPLFVSDTTLRKRKNLPRALGPWALDSGGFSEVSQHGHFLTPPWEYADRVKGYRDEIGNLEWVSPQDWMCEPFILQKTRASIDIHQWLTVESVLTLRIKLGNLVIPVLQGFTPHDYLTCAKKYERAGVNLAKEPVIGLGSVCRRQGMKAFRGILDCLVDYGLGGRLHGYGVKKTGLLWAKNDLYSADSMAWSFSARRTPILLDGHTHKNCANCLPWALQWREDLLSAIG